MQPDHIRIATDPDGISHLRNLFGILQAVAHPSIIAVEATRFETRRAEISFEPVIGTPLDTTAGRSLEARVKALASAAAALAHVHDHDVYLRQIDERTFFVRNDGSAIVVGLDAAIRPASIEAKRNDVQTFVEFAQTVVGPTDALRERINGTVGNALRTSVHKTFDDAIDKDLDARRLAEGLRHALWFDNEPQRPHRSHRRAGRRSSKKWFAGAAGVAVVVFGSVGWVERTSTDSSNASSLAPVATTSCELRTGTIVDIDGDRCPDAIDITNGVVTINQARRFTADEPDARMTLGNWQCNGKPTLAVLRPSSGEVFVFDSWPGENTNEPSRRVGTYPGAQTLRVEHVGTCDTLWVDTPTGQQSPDVRKIDE